MIEQWTADGWLITDGWVRDVEMRDGLYRAAGKRGDNVEVANRRGLLWRRKYGDIGGFTLNLWLGDMTRAQVETWWDTLLRAVSPPHRLVRYNRTLAGGGSRYADGEITAAIEPQPLGNLGIRAALEVAVPDGVWWDGSGVETQVAAAGAALPKRLALGGRFAAVTAEQHDLIYRIDGPANNPQVYDVTDGVDGDWLAYDGVIAAGQSLTVNASTWAVTGTGGLAPDIAKVRYSGARYLVVPPARPGATPTVELRADAGSTGATTKLTVSGVPAYAC